MLKLKYALKTGMLIIVFLSLFCYSDSSNLTIAEHYKLLLDYLFGKGDLQNYNKWVRPINKQDESIEVKMKLTFRQLLDVDEKNQLMHTNVWIKQTWIDKKLTWNPNEFANLSSILIPSEWLWQPDIVLLENADGNFTVSHMTKALLRYDGKITWEPPAMYKSWCKIDVTYFPFDFQKCYMRFASWTYPNNQVYITPLETKMDVSQLLDNDEWQLVNAFVAMEYYHKNHGDKEDNGYSIEDSLNHGGLRFTLDLRRLPLFYIVFLITPCVGISFLTGVVFFLPPASKEKITLSTAVLLAHSFYLLAVIDIIPTMSNTIPLIEKYLLFTMGLITLSIVLTTMVISIHYQMKNTCWPIPNWVKRTTYKISPKLFGSVPKLYQKEDLLPKDLDLEMETRKKNINKAMMSLSKHLDPNKPDEIYRCFQDLTNRLEKRRHKKMELEEWIFAAMVLDRLILYIFLCVSTIGTILLFLPGLLPFNS